MHLITSRMTGKSAPSTAHFNEPILMIADAKETFMHIFFHKYSQKSVNIHALFGWIPGYAYMHFNSSANAIPRKCEITPRRALKTLKVT